MSIDRVIHIVDADPPALAHSAAILRAAGYKVQTHASGTDYLESTPDPRPGCILLDIDVPEPDGLAVRDELIKSGLTMPVIVFTGEGAIDIAVRAMRAGALHFLEKPYPEAELLAMIAEALERLDATEDSTAREARAVAQLATLSPREIQVMEGLSQGSPNKIIAHDLRLSIRTVEMYRTNLMEKLGARSLSTVFRIWFDAGH